MSLRSKMAAVVGKTVYMTVQTLTKGGSSFPGRVALKLDPTVLEEISKNYEVIIVTGTNGKTVTSALMHNVLKQLDPDTISNTTGANMLQGITSTFLKNYQPGRKEKRHAILEVDEASLVSITEYVKPHAIVFTNVFRDQLDRYGEVYTTLKLMLDGARLTPETKLFVNGDAPIFHDLDVPNPVTYFGFDIEKGEAQEAQINATATLCPHCKKPLKYNFITYNNLGDYYCETCDYKRPELTYRLNEVTRLTDQEADVQIDNDPYHLTVGGLYNSYNALSAYAIGREFGLSTEQLQRGLVLDQAVFGRQEAVMVGDKRVHVILVKNPVGFNQAIETIALHEKEFSLFLLMNNHYADGIDVSWIWDVNFEKLTEMPIPSYSVGGERYYDLGVRLNVAGIPEDEIGIVPTIDGLIEAIQKEKTDDVYVLTTYTAMLRFREELYKNNMLKGKW